MTNPQFILYKIHQVGTLYVGWCEEVILGREYTKSLLTMMLQVSDIELVLNCSNHSFGENIALHWYKVHTQCLNDRLVKGINNLLIVIKLILDDSIYYTLKVGDSIVNTMTCCHYLILLLSSSFVSCSVSFRFKIGCSWHPELESVRK